VAEIEPNRYLLLEVTGEGETEIDEVFSGADAASTWLFYLERCGSEQSKAGEAEVAGQACTRLIVRWRARWNLKAGPMPFLVGVLLDPVEFIMEQKMMRGIKERAEAQSA
jgi:hypothetical protein